MHTFTLVGRQCPCRQELPGGHDLYAFSNISAIETPMKTRILLATDQDSDSNKILLNNLRIETESFHIGQRVTIVWWNQLISKLIQPSG